MTATSEAPSRGNTPGAFDQLSPGVTIKVRDEYWLVTHVTRTRDGFKVKARGISDYVRDNTSTFYTALDRDLEVFDPAKVTIEPDNSPRFRRSRLWLESTIRQTPVPLYQDSLEVATRMLADPLDYQLSAVHKALSPERIRPRILLADAVGLGKTLEIGMIVAELIRRGRGERILVVTPKHVLEQFQQEMWTRFAVPLVRLDSQGIQKIRQKLPASKNPFTYFPRVIVSMDTLKSAKYKAQLEKVNWDIVVIDEIHNATNSGTQNNDLARTLAPRTEALILASATPHNGNPESFKEILKLLDPLSVRPDGSIDMELAEKLIIRRHRNSPEVKAVVGSKWAERDEPLNIPVDASGEENAVANEIRDTWIAPSGVNTASASTASATTPMSDKSRSHLFAWTLVKAFLSSPAALQDSIDNRLQTIKNQHGTSSTHERQALERLKDLNAKVTPEASNKYAALVNYLKDSVKIGKRSSNRVVVFSERVSTLDWLRENLIRDLKLSEAAVKIMHGGMSDVEQMELIDEFKRTGTRLRVLITGDVASEGVNLHAQCHDLVHYDIPWSLIRIQQRNGRIDRYGQEHSPRIAALLLDPADADAIGEIHVLTKLIEREYEANQLLGDAASLMGQHSAKREEDEIRDVLRGARDFDSTVRTAEQVLDDASARLGVSSSVGDSSAKHAAVATPAISGATAKDEFDVNALLTGFLAGGGNTASPISTATPADSAAAPVHNPLQHTSAKSLYGSEEDYLVDALSEAFNNIPAEPETAGGVELTISPGDILELTPPRDLQRRFDYLPQDYVDYRHVKNRLMLATSLHRGEAQLRAAREGKSEKSWPKAHFLGPLHPVSDWAADRALSSMERSQIPAFAGKVDKLSAVFMATLTNSRGQVITRSFVVTTSGPFGLDAPEGMPRAVGDVIEDPILWLRATGLADGAISTGNLTVPAEAQTLVKEGITVAEGLADIAKNVAIEDANERTDVWLDQATVWESEAKRHPSTQSLRRSHSVVNQERGLLKASVPERTLIRPLVIIIPAD
ncbi:DEAD/DEAH box helicase [Corynebacterium amycolatum]|uniref:DEAD/DEAH box helicase n=1 Tax=Corynebacterium amycolatum TaxID=43765 RepID=UPI00399C3A98